MDNNENAQERIMGFYELLCRAYKSLPPGYCITIDAGPGRTPEPVVILSGKGSKEIVQLWEKHDTYEGELREKVRTAVRIARHRAYGEGLPETEKDVRTAEEQEREILRTVEAIRRKLFTQTELDATRRRKPKTTGTPLFVGGVVFTDCEFHGDSNGTAMPESGESPRRPATYPTG